jgi:hemerythrin-like domain-containing protein
MAERRKESAMSPSARVDLFSLIHKGVRRLLFETAMEASRADFAEAEEVASVEAAVRRCFDLLREHADHEDRVIQPWVARSSGELAADLAAEHVALEKATIAVESLLPRLAGAAPDERRKMGVELQRRLHLLVADQLRHLDREEREANAVLWAHLPDETLTQLRSEILAQIPPPRLAEWHEILRQSLSASERAALAGSERSEGTRPSPGLTTR